MRTNSLNNSFISRMSYKKLNRIGRYIATIAVVLFLAIPQAWGADYYSRLKGEVSGGSGKVYVSTSETPPTSYKAGTYVTRPSKNGGEMTFYIGAEPAAGYYFVNWVEGQGKGTIDIKENKKVSPSLGEVIRRYNYAILQ